MRLNPTISEIQAPPLRSNIASHLVEKYIGYNQGKRGSNRQVQANAATMRILKTYEDMGGKL